MTGCVCVCVDFARKDLNCARFNWLYFLLHELLMLYQMCLLFLKLSRLHKVTYCVFYKHKNTTQIVTRGKKHKKKFKKALLKLVVLAAVLKVKLEFFLKVLATHLQVKFFIIALFGLLLNAAKFWLDLKKGHSPQKVSVI